jgi:hypothetical protein
MLLATPAGQYMDAAAAMLANGTGAAVAAAAGGGAGAASPTAAGAGVTLASSSAVSSSSSSSVSIASASATLTATATATINTGAAAVDSNEGKMHHTVYLFASVAHFFESISRVMHWSDCNGPKMTLQTALVMNIVSLLETAHS